MSARTHSMRTWRENIDLEKTGQDMYALARDLFPICRSITGDGNRKTLERLSKLIAIDVHEIPSGTKVFDWEIPQEWQIREAWIKNPSGTKVVDFAKNNLHVVSYSQPVHRKISRKELDLHLHSLPDRPEWIPYRTSYYESAWGFCLPHQLRASLPEGDYEVFIDSVLKPGSLTYGEIFLPGQTEEEFLFSIHICHPSLANDNVSGMVVGAHLARLLGNMDRRYSYRIIFIPGTIGSITWLAMQGEKRSRIRNGLVLANLGDAGGFTYKKTRAGDSLIDRYVSFALGRRSHTVKEFHPYGYDERQFGSPGINLPVGLLMRSSFGAFPEYHTSADNLDFIRPSHLAESLDAIFDIIEIAEGDERLMNTNPCCEPQLGRRGLYENMGGSNERHERQMAMLWVLNQSDGHHSLLDITERSGLSFKIIRDAADRLIEKDLLAKGN